MHFNPVRISNTFVQNKIWPYTLKLAENLIVKVQRSKGVHLAISPIPSKINVSRLRSLTPAQMAWHFYPV